MSDLLFGAICFGVFFAVIICIAIVISVAEEITGAVIGEWPKKIAGVFTQK